MKKLIVNFILLVVFSFGCSSTVTAPIKNLPEKFDLKSVSIKGMNIRYIDEGEGESIILVHGLPTSSFLWRHMIKDLSSNARVIVPDLPGYGFSDPPFNGDYSIPQYADFLESFINTLSIKDPTLICHDMGGPYTIFYALHHPEKYNRLVILDTFLYSDVKIPFFLKIFNIKPVGEILLKISGSYQKKIVLRRWGLVDKSLMTKEIANRYFAPGGNHNKMNTTMLETLRALSTDVEEEMKFIEQNLKNIVKPTLILWADKDKVLPYTIGERIHEDIKGSKIVMLKDCGHFLQEEQPKQATEIIIQFLRESSEREP